MPHRGTGGSTGQEEKLYIVLSEKHRWWTKWGKLWKCEEVGKDHFIIGDETLAVNNELSRLFVMSVPSCFQKPVSWFWPSVCLLELKSFLNANAPSPHFPHAMQLTSSSQGLGETHPFQQILWDRTASLLCTHQTRWPSSSSSSSPSSPAAFYLLSNIFPPAHSLCLHLSAFVKTAHRPLPLCLYSRFIPKLIQAVFLQCSISFCLSSFRKQKKLFWPAFSANLLLCSSGSEGCEGEPDPASRFWDELSHVGLPQDLKVQSLFESGKINRFNIFTFFTKHCWHFLCRVNSIPWLHHL